MVSSSYYCNSIYEPRISGFETNHPNPTGINSLPTYDELITETICSTSTTELPSYSEAMEQMFKKDQKDKN